MSNIHPQAIVEPGAQIGNHVTIEAFAVIKGTVTLEDHVVIKSHAYIDGNTTIGKRCEIREFVTINSSCQENSTVRIGDDCLIMAYCHVAHNCEIGNKVVMSNSAMLAGHVIVEDYAIIGGMTPVHQFSRIGCYAMVGGFSRVPRDVPPYTVGGGFPYKFGGINIIGLKRHKFPLEVRIALSKAFKNTYRSGLHLEDALHQIEREIEPCLEVQHWVEFCRSSKRGLIGLEGVAKKGDQDAEEEYFEE